MTNLVVGRVRSVDRTEGVIVLGHIKFWLPPGLALPELGVGTKVMATYGERDGKYWITDCRLDEEPSTEATTPRRPPADPVGDVTALCG